MPETPAPAVIDPSAPGQPAWHHRLGQAYRGRFAPSPSGPLHDGSLIAALASLLDARAHHGQWLLRIEDIDTPRVQPDADRLICGQLQALGMHWDGEPTWQSQRLPHYQAAFDRLLAAGHIYPCACTRQEIRDAATRPGAEHDSEHPYPGTCRNGLKPGRLPRAWRVRVPGGDHHFTDRWQGPQRQNLARDVGDFVLKRADGLWAYQLVVVADDGDQGITDIVRGADLLSSTARQQWLARMLGLAPPRTMHVPLAMAEDGRKLSKQNHAPALDLSNPVATLNRAWTFLGFDALETDGPQAFLARATAIWAARFGMAAQSSERL